MGKRKSSRRKPIAKPRAKLASTFDCVFCQADASVSVKIDRIERSALLRCQACKREWLKKDLKRVEETVDVYYEWVDELEEERRRDRLDGVLKDDGDDEDAEDGYAQEDEEDSRGGTFEARRVKPRLDLNSLDADEDELDEREVELQARLNRHMVESVVVEDEEEGEE